MSDRTVFVLDVSGSMAGAKCQTLHLETTRFIAGIPDNNYVGIVEFNGRATPLHELTRITSPAIRNALIAKVPKKGGGSTDIRAGIMEGLATFTRANVSTVGAKIFLATDGEHCVGNSDYVGDVLPHLKLAKVSVICVAIGGSADRDLDRLAVETQGKVYYLSRTDGQSREIMAQIMNAAMKEVVTTKEMAEVVTHTLVDQVVTIDGTDTYQMDVPFESDIGSNTRIQVRSEDIDAIDLTVRSPTGAELNTIAGQVTKRLDLKQCQLYMDTTEPGIWFVKVRNQSLNKVRAHMIVESEANGAHALNIAIYLKAPDVNCPPLIVCKLFKGQSVIVGATVTATVDRPDGTQTEFQLNKYHKDGYYYDYYTNYSGTGRYNVSVIAVNSDNNTTYQGRPTESFRRQRVASSFQVRDLTLIQAPANPGHFEQLLLSEQFGNLKINANGQSAGMAPNYNTGTANLSSSTNNPPTLPVLTAPLKARKQKLAVNYVKTIKAINVSNLSAQEKQQLCQSLDDFKRFNTSFKETSNEEIDSYQRRLSDILVQIKN